MKKININITLNASSKFEEPGDCKNCPLQKYREDSQRNATYGCILGCTFATCPVTVLPEGKSTVEEAKYES